MLLYQFTHDAFSFDVTGYLGYNELRTEISMIRTVFRLTYIGMFILGLLFCFNSDDVHSRSSNIQILEVDGTIVPVVANYIERGINDAVEQGSTVCIIKLNTPGGLLDATEDIVSNIMNAEVPVVVYVSPTGSWAASAGTFITISGHIAAMAPGTTMGAATPVSGDGSEIPEDMKRKVTEFSSAFIKSIAETRGRNQEEAALAVTEAKSFTASEALESNLINFQADNMDDLLRKINGRKVILASGREVIIDTTGDVLIPNSMNIAESFLHMVSNPNVAYVLMSLATIGLITEISNPGLIFPGVAGGISLLIAFYSLGTLNAYWAGILLIILAFGCFIAEIFTPTFGILTAGGLVSMVIGSLVMFSHNPPSLDINRGLIAVVSIIVAAFIILVIGAIVRGQKRQVETGLEALLGRTAIAQTRLNPRGSVLVEGERWSAVTEDGAVEPGEEVTVTRVDGLKLTVMRKKKEQED